MHLAVVLTRRDDAVDAALLPLDGTGTAGPVELVTGIGALAARVRAAEAGSTSRPRWVWPSTAATYSPLLRAGVRVERCHDLELTGALLDAHDGHWRPVSAGHPDDDVPGSQPSLFEGDGDGRQSGDSAAALAELAEAYRSQLAAIDAARRTSPGFGLLVAAESAAALAAAEMSAVGLPWDAARHDELLEAVLGPRPRHGGRPAVLSELAHEIAGLLDTPGLNPDSQPELLRGLRRAGLAVRSTRRYELSGLDHPVVAPLRRYKELSRLFAANGWAWREEWVSDGRFRPEYVPSGVVSGRWSSRGGGALQIPKALRAAVVADPGWALVVADAGQLEPRILAALSHDPGMLEATADPSGDLYTALARQAAGRADVGGTQRAEMKVALLSAMYGGGAAGPGMAALQRRFPTALAFLERAARIGEDGGLVRSVLGRTCPPPAEGWATGVPDTAVAARARARGRFTRNFVIQASAADWANTFLAGLRRLLAALSPGTPPELVFFLHDEVMVHTPAALAGDVVAAVHEAGAQACRLVLPEPVPVPLGTRIAATA